MIEGTACAEVSLTRNRRLRVEYSGETDVDWNSQRTKTDQGERLFVCCRQRVWQESQVLKATKARRGRKPLPGLKG